MTCGIIGLGHVGQAMHKRFPDAVLFDEPKGIGSRKEINQCDVAFVCVPTPSLDDGSCDTTIVEAVLTWVHCSVVIIRSTVPVGFTKRMARKHNLNLVFQPEYYGETVAHPFENLENQSWISLGGESEAVKLATCFYQERVNSNIRFYFSDSDTVELAEINGKIAFILNSASVSVDSSPCDVTWRINNDEIEDYLFQIPSYKRNGQIKEIIRKHLNAQGMLITGFSVPIETKQPKAKEQRKIEKQPRKRFTPPAQEKTKEEFVQTDEERDAIMALIAMGGE